MFYSKQFYRWASRLPSSSIRGPSKTRLILQANSGHDRFLSYPLQFINLLVRSSGQRRRISTPMSQRRVSGRQNNIRRSEGFRRIARGVSSWGAFFALRLLSRRRPPSSVNVAFSVIRHQTLATCVLFVYPCTRPCLRFDPAAGEQIEALFSFGRRCSYLRELGNLVDIKFWRKNCCWRWQLQIRLKLRVCEYFSAPWWRVFCGLPSGLCTLSSVVSTWRTREICARLRTWHWISILHYPWW